MSDHRRDERIDQRGDKGFRTYRYELREVFRDEDGVRRSVYRERGHDRDD